MGTAADRIGACGTFICLAMNDSNPAVLRLCCPSARRAASAGHILLVDDDAEIRGLIALLLGDAGYRVGCAADGEAAWSALCAEQFDLLITDHEMPKLTGLDLLRRVRSGPLDLPAIMISGFMPWGEADIEELLPPGAMVEKPFPMVDLLGKVRSFLRPTPRAGSTAARFAMCWKRTATLPPAPFRAFAR